MEDMQVYIDVEDGLKRVGNNMTLYKKLLSRFVDSNYSNALKTDINGDYDAGSHLAHTIKGVGANLSLIKVQAVATELEQRFKNKAEYEDVLSELITVIDSTVEKINSL